MAKARTTTKAKSAAKRKSAVAGKAKPKIARNAKGTIPPTSEPLSDSASNNATVLDRLYRVVIERRAADPAISHSARLLARGPEKVAQKFGEEAVECVIEGVTGNRPALIGESADVLYHLLVLWVARDISPDEVWAELRRREGVSGIAEKAARPAVRALGITTRKIP
jgi:phosphoribosyl-ATP pyrophosphohydrolase